MARTRAVAKAGAASLALLSSCASPAQGLRPPPALYFPVGVAVSPGGAALYVANSDFDLQFNAGTVQVYDLGNPVPNSATPALRDRVTALAEGLQDPNANIATVCQNIGVGLNPNTVRFRGPCDAIDVGPYLKKSVETGAFATNVLYVCQPNGVDRGGTDCSEGPAAGSGLSRLFVPVRGDPSLTYFDVADDRPGGSQDPFLLDCGQATNDNRCDDGHRLGVVPFDNTRGNIMPVEPFEVAAVDGGRALAVTHQVNGYMTLFTPPAGSPPDANVVTSAPVLQFVLGGLPFAVTGVDGLPVPEAVREALQTSAQTGMPAPSWATQYQPGLLTAFRSANQLDVIRFYDDQQALPARPFLQAAGVVPLNASASIDGRAVAVDNTPSSPRRACESACPADGSDRMSCLLQCADVPVPFYVGNRAFDVSGNPTLSTLLVGETRASLTAQGSGDFVSIFDAVELSYGVSRVVIGRIKDTQGQWRQRIFATLFDAQAVYIYDPVAKRIEAVVNAGRGPYAIAFDPVQPLAYIAHFTDSYIGVIDLDASRNNTFETLFATLGQPQAPRETQ
jgi:DNA-binding beta-propeller fold protein YncE